MRKGDDRYDGDSSAYCKDNSPVEKAFKPKYIQVSAKCSDMCAIEFQDENGHKIASMDGYVPDFMPGEHFGDYIILTIELHTGKIVDWVRPSIADLKDALKKGQR